VIRILGAASIVRGRRTSVENYLSKEEFGIVDPDLDYMQSTHRLDRMNYMFDDFEGTPIRFSTMLRPVAEALLNGGRL
jgi:hypothetical protein